MRHKLWLLLATLLVLAPQPALARARDDVMAGVFRCAAIGDARLWLDCYYGAAQPVRAELNMPPVPAAQARLAQSPPAGGAAGDMTARYQVTSAVLRCNGLFGDREWLDCYYGAAQPVRAQLGLSPSPQARVQPPPAGNDRIPVVGLPAARSNLEPAPQQQFGMRKIQPANDGARVVSRMDSYSFNHYGIFTVTLANGQVWRQLSGDTDFAHWTKPAASYTASVTRGALGSFNLKVKGGSEAFKVERVN